MAAAGTREGVQVSPAHHDEHQAPGAKPRVPWDMTGGFTSFVLCLGFHRFPDSFRCPAAACRCLQRQLGMVTPFHQQRAFVISVPWEQRGKAPLCILCLMFMNTQLPGKGPQPPGRATLGCCISSLDCLRHPRLHQRCGGPATQAAGFKQVTFSSRLHSHSLNS